MVRLGGKGSQDKVDQGGTALYTFHVKVELSGDSGGDREVTERIYEVKRHEDSIGQRWN